MQCWCLKKMYLNGDALVLQLDWIKWGIMIIRLHLNGNDAFLDFKGMKRGNLLRTRHLNCDVPVLTLDEIKCGILVIRLHLNGVEQVLEFDGGKRGILLKRTHLNGDALVFQPNGIKWGVLVMKLKVEDLVLEFDGIKKVSCSGQCIWMVTLKSCSSMK